MKKGKIFYTKTDEAPALATESFLPLVRAFTQWADIDIEVKDISLAHRLLAQFPDCLEEGQRVSDALVELGEIAKDPNANIIKLPNISASIPQLNAAISELQSQGYNLPVYPETPQTDQEKEIQSRYAKVLGSAVNPVLREGNSDRRVAEPVKEYAQKHPHSMGQWSESSQTHVASMSEGDFYSSEKSVVMDRPQKVKIEFVNEKGQAQVLRDSLSLLEGEVIDASVMSIKALCDYYELEMAKAKGEDLLLSLHLKATMMKVSDPVIFGHAVRIYFKDVFTQYTSLFNELGIEENNGFGDVLNKIKNLPEAQRKEIEGAIQKCFQNRPSLAMVDSEQGITNLHVPSDVIIDASMPACIRSSGKMWGSDGQLQDTKALIPDRCYAGVYQVVIDFCKKQGAFDPRTMGTVSNVGLMAKKAEEYGSHDKTFEVKEAGLMRVLSESGVALIEHKVSPGDIWRMCQTKDVSVKDWVKLAVNRARATKDPAIFWLDENRPHDVNLIQKVKKYLKDHDVTSLDIQILSPIKATEYTLQRVREGKNTISVTGNVLRDYLTDLFPILELGTSAKMLSIVPLLAGGGLYETGAGGSAPKHVQQFLSEGHLRWDSLGEFLALAVSIEDYGLKNNNKKALVLAQSLNQANRRFLNENKSPSRRVGELDSRGSHFYLALYWAQALSEQNEDADLKAHFSVWARSLEENENRIIEELNQAQGRPVDIGGYYHPNEKKLAQAMRPSATLVGLLQ